MKIRMEPMTDEQYARYRQYAEDDYAQSIMDSGGWPRAEALEKAREDFRRLLPDGLRSAGHRLLTAYDDTTEIGILWLHTESKTDGLHAYIYDVEVRAELRRRGYGRAVMREVDRLCRELGALTVGLNVFGFNTGARALYEEMGYEVVSVQMRKRL